MSTQSAGLVERAAATVSESAAREAVLGIFDANRRRRIAVAATLVLRYGLVTLLLVWAAFKITAREAEDIRPLVENSPLLSWLCPLLGIRGTAALIGVVELTAALLMSARHWKPSWSAVGSLIASGTFVISLSFLFTTPGIWDPSSPWGGFLMKDLVLLGAALYTAAEALEGAARHA